MSAPDMEWTEKYRPKDLKGVIGNDRARARMLRWGEGWVKGCPLGKCEKTRDEIMSKKALVLAGPPGIGKTTSALALAKELGWSVIEMNASDTRNADAVKRIALSGAITQGFTAEGEYVRSGEGERKLIILDEADNLSGNSDRGGIKAIVDVIKRTSQPIILIVNDLYALQRRSSFFKKRKSSPLEIIYFNRPNDAEIKDFLMMVAEKEGLDIGRDAVEEIAVRAAGDVRGALNDLQSFAYSDTVLADIVAAGTRDRELSTTEALRGLYGSVKVSEGLAYLRKTDEQPSNTLLWIDELLPKIARNDRSLAASYAHLSRADIYLSRVFRRQQYSLWKYASDEMAASVLSLKGPGLFPRSLFPLWLSAMGRSKGNRATRKSLALKLAVYLHTTSDRITHDVLEPFGLIFKRDEDFMLEMIWRLDLNEKEVNFIIDDPARSKFAVEKANTGRKRKEDTIFGKEGEPFISTGKGESGDDGLESTPEKTGKKTDASENDAPAIKWNRAGKEDSGRHENPPKWTEEGSEEQPRQVRKEYSRVLENEPVGPAAGQKNDKVSGGVGTTSTLPSTDQINNKKPEGPKTEEPAKGLKNGSKEDGKKRKKKKISPGQKTLF